MTKLARPDRALLEEWLTSNNIEHYLCGECEGLHVRVLQELEGVVNSRVFLQQTHLLCSTELEIRPMAVLPLASDLGRINMDYPTLKVFMDIVDDETPQLVVASNMLASAGIEEQQFAAFMLNVIDGTRLLADECLQLDYLFAEAGGPRAQGSRSVH
tara:strand:+ start:19994 stop:20464 length:471 start_codon:yes stop_codon:yes gene_type:complete